jgi:hypothetical protein
MSEYFTLFKRADLAAAAAHSVGGYIITPAGDLASLKHTCDHYAVCHALYDKDECTAQELGVIRVSFAGRCTGMEIEWETDCVSITALQTLRALLPHYEGSRDEISIDDGHKWRSALDHKHATRLITAAISRRTAAQKLAEAA